MKIAHLLSQPDSVCSASERTRSALVVLKAFAEKMIDLGDAEDLAWYVAREVVGRLGFVDCVVYFIDAKQNVLRQTAAIGTKNPAGRDIVNCLEIPIGNGVTGHVAATGKPALVSDLTHDGRYIPDVEDAQSEVCVPLFVDGLIFGVIDCEDPRAGYFKQQHIELLETIAALAGARLSLMPGYAGPSV